MPVRSRGFTLIEIMLVIVIIGCAVGIVVLSIPGMPGSRSSRDMAAESEQLAAVVRLAAEQAVLEGRTLGLRIDPHGYRFLVRQPRAAAETASQPQGADTMPNWDDLEWVPYRVERFPGEKTYGEDVELGLELGGLALESEEAHLGVSERNWLVAEPEAPMPQILLLPGGEMTPFTLTITEGQGEQGFYRQIRGDETGQVNLLTRDQLDTEGR